MLLGGRECGEWRAVSAVARAAPEVLISQNPLSACALYYCTRLVEILRSLGVMMRVLCVSTYIGIHVGSRIR